VAVAAKRRYTTALLQGRYSRNVEGTIVATKRGKARRRGTKGPAPQIGARALVSAQVSVTTRGKTVRDQVVDIFVAVTGHSDVEKRPLKDLTACCDEGFRATVAKKVTDTWSNLDHAYGANDIQCADTVDTLANRVSGDLV
jgi:hypothetical protein